MSKVRIYGDTSGYVDIAVPAVAGTRTLNLDKVPQTDTSGNTGIGTDAPFTRAVVGDGSGTEVLTIFSGNNGEGQLRFADGTAGSATYQGRVEYDHSAGKLNLGAGGATPVTIDSSGNVGIGTNSPGQKLHVSSTDNTRILITGGTDKYAELQFENDAQKFAMGVQNDDKFFLYNSTGTSQVLTIDTSNNVGIGTQNPDQKMHLYTGSGTTLYKAEVNANSTVGLEIKKTGSTTQSWQIADGITHNGALQFYDVTDAAVRMHIDGDGRIGIGESSPDTLLHISGAPDSKVITLDQNGRASAIGTYFSSGSTDSRIDFYVSDGNTNGSSNNRMSIMGSGNVGIGTDSPQFKLHVNKQTDNYAPTNGVDENVVAFQDAYDAGGSHILTFSNLDGNWVDGTSGADSAFGWLWGYQNKVRGGLVYDHRGSERMQMWASYGAIGLMTADSADDDAVPTDSNMNERITILPGGKVGINNTAPVGHVDIVVPQDRVPFVVRSGGKSNIGYNAGHVMHCYNSVGSSGVWYDVCYVSHSPNIFILGSTVQDGSAHLGGSRYCGRMYGTYGSVTQSTFAGGTRTTAMNGGVVTGMDYRYLNSGASSGSYRLQVYVTWSGAISTMEVYTTVIGNGADTFQEDN